MLSALLRLGDLSILSNFKERDEANGRGPRMTSEGGLQGLHFRNEALYHTLQVVNKTDSVTSPEQYQELSPHDALALAKRQNAQKKYHGFAPGVKDSEEAMAVVVRAQLVWLRLCTRPRVWSWSSTAQPRDRIVTGQRVETA